MLVEKTVQIKTGDRVLIVGDSGTGKTLLFRALAGLWPWGSGTIIHPPDRERMYMPRTPYLPPGTLREVLAYPSTTGTFDHDAFANALLRLKLDRLVPMLDSSLRWDRELSEEEQQSLAFARVVLHKRPWVLIDEVLDSLPDDALELVIDIFTKDLAQTGVLHIGRTDAHHFFPRVLHLIKDPAGRKLAGPAPAAPAAADLAMSK
jgi:putative ATP-binding cassette transporter